MAFQSRNCQPVPGDRHFLRQKYSGYIQGYHKKGGVPHSTGELFHATRFAWGQMLVHSGSRAERAQGSQRGVRWVVLQTQGPAVCVCAGWMPQTGCRLEHL